MRATFGAVWRMQVQIGWLRLYHRQIAWSRPSGRVSGFRGAHALHRGCQVLSAPGRPERDRCNVPSGASAGGRSRMLGAITKPARRRSWESTQGWANGPPIHARRSTPCSSRQKARRIRKPSSSCPIRPCWTAARLPSTVRTKPNGRRWPPGSSPSRGWRASSSDVTSLPSRVPPTLNGSR